MFREFCTINRGTAHDEGVTRIGNDNLFMAYSHVAHDCQVGRQRHLGELRHARRPRRARRLGDPRRLPAVHQFCKIGAHAFLGDDAIVTRDVPPYVMVAGNPAEPHASTPKG